ncbi:hypothetical protein OG592_17610 [Streptomyces avidinii]|uniref:hypothetical protein n=1 Tax=Streptomyces avidinii TaxID=1895 RepID=UPI00386BD53A|nr:hypothetical protein OG592_17610 [Streptomyces avidinii]
MVGEIPVARRFGGPVRRLPTAHPADWRPALATALPVCAEATVEPSARQVGHGGAFGPGAAFTPCVRDPHRSAPRHCGRHPDPLKDVGPAR